MKQKLHGVFPPQHFCPVDSAKAHVKILEVLILSFWRHISLLSGLIRKSYVQRLNFKNLRLRPTFFSEMPSRMARSRSERASGGPASTAAALRCCCFCVGMLFIGW